MKFEYQPLDNATSFTFNPTTGFFELTGFKRCRKIIYKFRKSDIVSVRFSHEEKSESAEYSHNIVEIKTSFGMLFGFDYLENKHMMNIQGIFHL